jgi:hypothetical protein
MALSSQNARLAIDAADATEWARSATISVTQATAESTTLSSQAVEHLPTTVDATISAEALVTVKSADKLASILGSASPAVVTFAPHGSSLGSPAELAHSHETSLEIQAPTAELVVASIEVQITGGAERGEVLLGATVETSGAGSASDNVVTTESGALIHTHAHGVSGDGVEVLIQHSADGVAWATIATINATSAGATRSEIPGTVLRYLRAAWDAAPASSADLLVAIARR